MNCQDLIAFSSKIFEVFLKDINRSWKRSCKILIRFSSRISQIILFMASRPIRRIVLQDFCLWELVNLPLSTKEDDLYTTTSPMKCSLIIERTIICDIKSNPMFIFIQVCFSFCSRGADVLFYTGFLDSWVFTLVFDALKSKGIKNTAKDLETNEMLH